MKTTYTVTDSVLWFGELLEPGSEIEIDVADAAFSKAAAPLVVSGIFQDKSLLLKADATRRTSQADGGGSTAAVSEADTEKILAAISDELHPVEHLARYTRSGMPKTDAVSAILDRGVSADERDQLWDAVGLKWWHARKPWLDADLPADEEPDSEIP